LNKQLVGLQTLLQTQHQNLEQAISTNSILNLNVNPDEAISQYNSRLSTLKKKQQRDNKTPKLNRTVNLS
jgi:hypothetical protein